MNVKTPHFRIQFFIVALLLAFCASVSATRGTPSQKDSRGLRVQPASLAVLPTSSKRYALVIGVDEYQDAQINKLEGATNDAKSIVDALIQYAGFPRDQVILLTGDQPAERKPTRGNILRRLSNLRTAVPKDGLLLVGFAGHGIEREGKAFLLPSDAQVSGDILLLEDTAINVEDMSKRIVQTGVGQVLMILDACRNDPTAGRGDSDNPLTNRYTKAFTFEERNSDIQAFATLYATDVGHRAYEYTEKKQGYFTWALVEGLKGAAANANGEVTLGGLLTYLQATVPRRIQMDLGAGKSQRPYAVVQGYKASDLVLAKTAVAENIAIPDPAAIERSAWERAQSIANVAAYRDYLKKYPGGVFAEEALWESIRGSKSPDDFKRYLKSYPNGKNAALASMLAEDSLWDRIQGSKNAADYQVYLKEYPEGRYAEIAISRIKPPPPLVPKVGSAPPKPVNAVLFVITNAPAAGISIKPRDASLKPIAGKSNADGKFRTELLPGLYDVEVSAAKYESKRVEGVNPEADNVVKVELTPLIGSIQIGPVAANATVLLDGQRPVKVNVKPEDKLIELLEIPVGAHKLKVLEPNRSEWTRDIEVEGGKTKYIPTEFKTAIVSMLVRTEPEAEVYIDDNYGGRANEKGELKVSDLTPGPHDIKVKKNEFKPIEKTQTFAEGSTEMKMPLTRVVFSPEFVDEFTGGLSWWAAPKTWKAAPGKLQVQGPGIGLIKDSSFKDFRMEFDLAFTNGKGAAWVLRGQDENTYYLFQLTGPASSAPNMFKTFIYENGQVKPLKLFRVPENLGVPGDKFHIIIEAHGPEIKHSIQVKSNPKATQPQPFSLMSDTTFSNGKIGFGTVDGEAFIVQFVSIVPAK